MKPIIKICKHHGELTIDQCYLKEKNRFRCAICHLVRVKKYYDKNKKIIYEKNVNYVRCWRKRHPEQAKAHKRKSYNLRVSELSDYYVKKLLSRNSTLKYNQIPENLIQMKRIALQIQRKIKEME